MWIALIAVPLILFGLFCYGAALVCMAGIIGWAFNIKQLKGENPPSAIIVAIFLFMIFGTICMSAAHHVYMNF